MGVCQDQWLQQRRRWWYHTRLSKHRETRAREEKEEEEVEESWWINNTDKFPSCSVCVCSCRGDEGGGIICIMHALAKTRQKVEGAADGTRWPRSTEAVHVLNHLWRVIKTHWEYGGPSRRRRMRNLSSRSDLQVIMALQLAPKTNDERAHT